MSNDSDIKMIDTTTKSDKTAATRVEVKREQKIKEVKTEVSGGGSTMLYVGLAVAATAAAGLAFYLMRKKN